MSTNTLIFLFISVTALMFLPRRWAPLPFLIGACYMTLAQTVNVGPFSFSFIRLLILFGFIRVFLRGERFYGKLNIMDMLMISWGFATAFSGFFHPDPFGAVVFRLGFAYNAFGTYLLFRIFIRSIDDLSIITGFAAIVFVPVAIEMLYEKATGYNLFGFFLGGVPVLAAVREGEIRAQGPFAHAILAGTVGAACIPLMIGFWRDQSKKAAIGILACGIMILTCASSGPILSAMAGIGALCMWKFRQYRGKFLLLGILAYIALDLVMQAPAYFILGRIDLTGGSTGWHRAQLIHSAITHLDEWWLAGTDYTRHWMPTGVTWSPDHTDITNYYLKMGVLGGLPMMLLFIAVLLKAFKFLSVKLGQEGLKKNEQFTLWALGASLFSLATTSISVSFFDQSFLFFYLVLAAIGSIANPQHATHDHKKSTKVVKRQRALHTSN